MFRFALFTGPDTRRRFVPLQGGPFWHGEAIDAYAEFNFLALRWGKLKRVGKTRDGILCVKAGRSRHVLRVSDPLPFGARAEGAVYVKRYLINSLRRRLGNILSGGKATREFRLGWRLLARGFVTPEPLAWAIATPSRIFGPPVPKGYARAASFLLTRELANDGSLTEWAKAGRTRSIPGLYKRLAAFLARMHALGFYHDDCSAKNLGPLPALQEPESEFSTGILQQFYILDIDHGRLYSRPVPLRRRWVNLCQLLRSLRQTDMQDLIDRQRFVIDYLRAAGLEPQRYLERAVAAIDRIARRKIGSRILSES